MSVSAIVRTTFVVVALSYGAITGGFMGFFGMLMTCGFISMMGLVFFGPPKPRAPKVVNEIQYDEIYQARRGSEVDPTRPDYKG